VVRFHFINSKLREKHFSKHKVTISPIIRPDVIFEDDFNVRPTLKISPSRLVGIELSENSAGILGTDDLQDITEDDDMIVFE